MVNFLGEPAQFLPSSEPSNIIWENLEIDKKTMKKRKLWVMLAILIFILLTYVFFTFLKSKTGTNKLKYPSSLNCTEYDEVFSSQD